MQYRSLVSVAILGSLALGCGGGTVTNVDAGPRGDAGSGLLDAEPQGDGAVATGSTARVSVSGARTAVWDYVDSETATGHYVSCVGDSSGFFSLSAYERAGGDDGFNFSMRTYDGPGTYTFTYNEPGYTNLTSAVRLSGGYEYHFFYSTLADFSQLPSICTITIDDSTTDERVVGDVSCSAMPANSLSPDYVRFGEGDLPTVGVTAHFECDL